MLRTRERGPAVEGTTNRHSETNLAQMRQRERFKWFAERLEGRVERHGVDELKELFDSPPSWPGQREKILVLLALKDEEGAREALESLEIADKEHNLRVLHRVAVDVARARR